MRRDTVAPVVERALAAVSGMPAGEVIVVPNGPAEGRRVLELRSPRLRVIESPVPGIGAARNLGLREVRNDVVLFIDDDCLTSTGWVDALTRRLGGEEIAVTTPVDVERRGPITAFIDYQRYFHARPLDAAIARYAIGASIGVRRDRIRIWFDEEMRGGEDVDFGCRLSDSGISTAYVAEAPPLLHLLPEEIETITGRFRGYGPTTATHFLSKDRPEFSIPYATPMHQSLCRNQLETPRRFEEFGDRDLRELFAGYDLMALGCLIAGYLDETGKLLGRDLVQVDDEALAAGWRRIDEGLRTAFRWEGNWNRLPIEFERWYRPRETAKPAVASAVAENLARNAPLLVQAGPDPGLDRAGDQIKRRADEMWATANRMLGDLRAGRLDPQVEVVESRLRASGIAFREGMQTMETIALGPVRASAETVG